VSCDDRSLRVEGVLHVDSLSERVMIEDDNDEYIHV